jgi:hypothetical protein
VCWTTTAKEETLSAADNLLTLFPENTENELHWQVRTLLNLTRCFLQLAKPNPAQTTALKYYAAAAVHTGAIARTILSHNQQQHHEDGGKDALLETLVAKAVTLTAKAHEVLQNWKGAAADWQYLLKRQRQRGESTVLAQRHYQNAIRQQQTVAKRERKLVKQVCQWVDQAQQAPPTSSINTSPKPRRSKYDKDPRQVVDDKSENATQNATSMSIDAQVSSSSRPDGIVDVATSVVPPLQTSYAPSRFCVFSAKESVLQSIQDAWKDRLEMCFPDKSSLDESQLLTWRDQTLSQIASLYRCYDVPNIEELNNIIEVTVTAWRKAPPVPKTAPKPKSFSLFSMGGGLAAFFSWPSVLDNSTTDAEIWHALMKVEFLEDIWPDWTSGIRSWIQTRIWQGQQAGVDLHRSWYDTAKKQESPETIKISLDLMENIFLALDGYGNSDSDTLCLELLTLGIEMVSDFMVRKASCPPDICMQVLWKASFSPTLVDCIIKKDPQGHWLRLYLQTHPTLYRQMSLDISLLGNILTDHKKDQAHRKYAMSLLAHLLAILRTTGFPWQQWPTDSTTTAQFQVYQLLLKESARQPANAVYLEGLEAVASALKVPSVPTTAIGTA